MFLEDGWRKILKRINRKVVAGEMRMIPQLLEARGLRIPGLEVVGSRRSLGEEVVGVHME